MNEALWYRLIVPLAFGAVSVIQLFSKGGMGVLVDVVFLCLSAFLIGGIMREKAMEK